MVMPALSKAATRRLNHTSGNVYEEVHRDGKQYRVTRIRFNMKYYDRSKYTPNNIQPSDFNKIVI